MRINGVFEVLPKDDPRDADHGTEHAPLEDCFEVWTQAFAWLVIALPVSAAEIQTDRHELTGRIPLVRSQAVNSEDASVQLERDQAWHRELSRGEQTGLWRIHLLAGGDSPAAARHVAGVLCASADVERLCYVLHPTPPYPQPQPGATDASLGDVLLASDAPSAGPPEARRGSGASPFLGSTEVLAAISQQPRREIYGVRMRLQPTFDITPEVDGDIALGPILDRNLATAGTLSVTRATLNRHTFVCGATGSGKSQTVRALLEGLARAEEPVPWLVIEPAKREYAVGMAGRLGPHVAVRVLRPGDPRQLPLSLNPLEPAPGFPLQTHVDLVRALFLAAFEADEPFPQVLAHALTRSYERCGWDLALGAPVFKWTSNDGLPRYPNLGDLQRACKVIVDRIGYSKQIADNVRGFVDVRVGSLRLGSSGRFFEGGHPLDFSTLLHQNVVLEMENLANDQDKAFLIGSVLIRLFETLRVRHECREAVDDENLQHLTVVEEAHRLLKIVPATSPSAAHAVELFASLLAEIRAYGEGIVIAEQIPSKILSDVLKNTALKIVHRLPAADDRSAVGATMNLSPEQSEYVVTLRSGVAAAFTDSMDRPLLIAIPGGMAREQGTPVEGPRPSRRRGAACGSKCQGEPCTLVQMRRAEEIAAVEPLLQLWIEVAVICHLTGLGGVRPPGALTRLRHLERRTLECAVAGLTEAAVEARYPYLLEFCRPEELSQHLASYVVHRLHPEDIADPCHPERDRRWRAGRFRFSDIVKALQDPSLDRGQRHPASDDWLRTRNVDLRGDSCDEQLQDLRAHPWSNYHHYRQLYWGDADPPGLQRGARLPEPLDKQRERLASALTFVMPVSRNWLLDQLFQG